MTKINPTVKDKCKIQIILRETGVSKPLKPYSMLLKTFLCSLLHFFKANKVICEL